MLSFQLLNDGAYYQNFNNISRNIWTSGVECGKICIGEQPGFYTWRLDGFAPVKKEGCHMMILDIVMCVIALCQLIVMVLALFQDK